MSDERWELLLRLRTRGVSYPSLAAVATELWGWRLSATVIREELRRRGAPANSSYARGGRA